MTIVICQTEGCVKAGVPAEFEEIGDTVWCGACGQVITDIKAA